MCTGRTHVTAGYPWGVTLAAGLGFSATAQIGCGILTAGSSALNDLDCKGASAARVLGPVSGALSWAVRRYADAIYGATRGQGDPAEAGTHRKATHAIPVLLLVQTPTLLAAPHVLEFVAHWATRLLRPDLPAEAIGSWVGAGFVAAVIGFCALMVLDRLDSRLLAGLAVVALATSGLLASVDLTDPAGMWRQLVTAVLRADVVLWGLSPWVAVMVLAGTTCHVVFDQITEGGTPFGAPLVTEETNKGAKRWVVIRLPEWLAIETGGWFERYLLYPVCVISCVLVTPALGVFVLDVMTPWLPGAAQGVVQALR